MYWRVGLATVATAALAVAGSLHAAAQPISPSAAGATTTTTTIAGDGGAVDAPVVGNVGGPADAPMQATRGSSIQETPTLPPPQTEPPSTQPPPPPPPDTGVPFASGFGRRVVYSKSRMRVWIVDGNNVTIRTYRVSGRIGQPDPGTYHVFSRSSFTCNIDHPNICMRWMVRFTQGPLGDNIGFHEIPRNNGVPVQSDAQLGQPLSGGCVRQSTDDALFMWNFAGIGTTVVVYD